MVPQSDDSAPDRRRLDRFRRRIGVYLVGTLVLLGANFWLEPDLPWAFAILVPWGLWIAYQVARLMHLF